MKQITLLLVDDHTIVRQGLRLLLEAAEDIRIIGEAQDGRQAVAEAERLRPDVVLMDLAMPHLSGVEATRLITKTVPGPKVLVLSSYSNGQTVKQAIEAGAAGYVLKEAAGDVLLGAIRDVHRGNAFFSPSISKGLLDQWRGSDSETTAGNSVRLSARQTEILQLIAEGHTTNQIAGLLPISRKTVEKHRQALMDKLNLHKIAALTRYAVSSGCVELNGSFPTRGPRPFEPETLSNPAA